MVINAVEAGDATAFPKIF